MKNLAAPLGILGDGQLSLMLGESAKKHALPFKALCDSHDSSFSVSFPNESAFKNDLGDHALQRFSSQCSVLTLENEFLPSKILSELELQGQKVIPPSSSYAHFESKFHQRTLYQKLGIPSPRWLTLKNEGKDPDKILTLIQKEFPVPFVMKASAGGYDGYGVKMIERAEEVLPALKKFEFYKDRVVILEEKISIAHEFAQGALFDGKGGINFLPCVETIQNNGICEIVLSHPAMPADEFEKIQGQIKSALNTLAKFGLCGLFNFEFFYTHDKRILINEGAPRPHNSQHLTINASLVSQFDLLIRFLGEGKLPFANQHVIEAKPSAMINLLGQSTGEKYSLSLPALPKNIEVYSKLYGKKECRPGRKMGHLILIDQTGAADLRALAAKILKEYRL